MNISSEEYEALVRLIEVLNDEEIEGHQYKENGGRLT
jgi:hypothetical protein